MSFMSGAISSIRGNRNLQRKAGYFKKRGEAVTKNMRIGKPNKKFGMNGESYAEKKKRAAIALRKGFVSVMIVIFSIIVISVLTIYILS